MKRNKSMWATAFLSICVGFIGLFYACSDSGNGNNLSATVSPVSGDAIVTSDKIVIKFSNSMDKTSLSLGGTMSSDSAEGAWSKTTLDNDTLTLSPTTGWDASGPGTLSVVAEDISGNEVTVDLDYVIKLKLSTFQNAKLVVGQTDFVSANSGTSAHQLSNPVGSVIGFGGKLYAPDYGNNRVLIYNSFPTANDPAANIALGQVNLTTSVSGAASNNLAGPIGIAIYKNKLFVADHENHRVLIWNSIPTSNAKAADVVLGQAAFGTNASGCSSTTMNYPYGIAVAGNKLMVSDKQNNRILIWNSIPTTNGKAADVVLGQNSFTNCAANDDDQSGASDLTTSQRTLDYPQGLWSDGKKLIAVDSNNNRVLIWNSIPTTKFKKADLVLGQGDFTHNVENDNNQDGAADATPSARTFYFSSDDHVASNGTQLFITDTANNRVLMWDEFPTTNFQEADAVFGQGDFTHATSDDANQDDMDDGAPSAKTLGYPDGVSIVGNHLIITDDNTGRYLVFEGQ